MSSMKNDINSKTDLVNNQDVLLEKIKKELLFKMKFMDTTIKGIAESDEYKEASIYNAGIRDALKIVDRYKNN